MNQALRDELLDMRNQDITTRQTLVDRGELEGAYHPEMKAVHERNNRRIREIVQQHGWPRLSEVSEDGSEAAWLIVQHAVLDPGFQEACIPLLQAAVESGEAHGWQLAYLEDRVLVGQGKRQRFGTQHDINDGVAFPLPTDEPDTVNERRAALGLWTQEEHTAAIQREHDLIQQNKAQRSGKSV